MKFYDAGIILAVLAAYWVISDVVKDEPVCYVDLPDAPYLAKMPCSDVPEMEAIK